MSRCTKPAACTWASASASCAPSVAHLVGRQRALLDPLGQRRTLDQVGDHERPAGLGAAVVQPDQPGVLAAGPARPAPAAAGGGRAARRPGRNSLTATGAPPCRSRPRRTTADDPTPITGPSAYRPATGGRRGRGAGRVPSRGHRSRDRRELCTGPDQVLPRRVGRGEGSGRAGQPRAVVSARRVSTRARCRRYSRVAVRSAGRVGALGGQRGGVLDRRAAGQRGLGGGRPQRRRRPC